MLSHYAFPPNSHKRRQKISNDNSNSEHDFKRPQMTSNDLKSPQKIEVVKPDSNADSSVNHIMNKRSKLKGRGNIEINEN